MTLDKRGEKKTKGINKFCDKCGFAKLVVVRPEDTGVCRCSPLQEPREYPKYCPRCKKETAWNVDTCVLCAYLLQEPRENIEFAKGMLKANKAFLTKKRTIKVLQEPREKKIKIIKGGKLQSIPNDDREYDCSPQPEKTEMEKKPTELEQFLDEYYQASYLVGLNINDENAGNRCLELVAESRKRLLALFQSKGGEYDIEEHCNCVEHYVGEKGKGYWIKAREGKVVCPKGDCKELTDYQKRIEEIMEKYADEEYLNSEENGNYKTDRHIKKMVALLQEVRSEERKRIRKNIGFLRQYLNEDRITNDKKMVTNETLELWLFTDKL
jgi:hypothetical protein